MANEGIAKWFGLKRPNFILNPKDDADFYARRTRVDIPSLVESLRTDLVTELPPKRLFWGVYGGGKTHTLFTLCVELGEIIAIRPVYVECPNLSKKATFLHLYHGIVTSMGRDFVVGLFEELIRNIGLVQREDLLKKLEEMLEDEELSRAIASLLGADPSKKLSFWRYISGVSVPPRDLADLGQTQGLTEAQPAKLAQFVIILGKVLKQVNNQTLVFILDELDRLLYVGEETGSTFEDAFRKLVDPNQRDVSILMGCSARNIKELPAVFGGEVGPVLTRIGKSGLIEIPEIDSNDVDTFIKEVIDYVRDKSVDITQRIKEIESEISENLEPDYFPFTKEAIETLKGNLTGIMTPREIEQRMTQAAGKSYLMKKPVITRDIIG